MNDEAPVVWRLSPYKPQPTEYARDMEWRAALRSVAPALRLTRCALSEISGPGALLPLASYRVPLDDVAPVGACILCGQVGRTPAVTTSGLRVHRACLPADLTHSPHLETLLMFAEELTERRTLRQVLSLRRPDLLT